MKPHVLLTCTVSLPPPPPPPPQKRSLPLASSCSPPLSFLRHNAPFACRLRPFPNFKVVEAVRFDGPFMDEGEDEEESELIIESVVVRTLSPALTLERGLESITKAVEELKLKPPLSPRGVLRFQVVVPPGPKALAWFCCQPESSGLFPRFFLSAEAEENPSPKSLHLGMTPGVFGIGAAVYFMHSSSGPPGDQTPFKRYLSSDSILMTIYGFKDANCNMELSSIKLEPGSFWFFIPEVELNEREDVSILAATLAWDESCFCTFNQALQSFQASLCQAGCHLWPTTERCHSNYISSALRKMDLEENEILKLVSLNALMFDRKEHQGDHLELGRFKVSSQFCFKLSATICVSSNMLDRVQESSCTLQDHANINAVWASLIVEECTRLGVTYFCVAPGSRSSPLAIAASAHPLTMCVACYDERSLAFHAVGYARGSQKPAVVITTSGTAVSNLLPAVVEASQDFVPLILLTADRPPELQDAGANQAIDQVNHFGSFVRFFFGLPVPTDIIPARMVLTTLDSAVYHATSSPCGPVHINCPFRDPLDDSPQKWMSSCLKGLDSWITCAQPFTKYMKMQNGLGCGDCVSVEMTEVLKMIQDTQRGLLLVGAIHTEDEIWATLLLAKHLNWPVVPDILSGLRLRKVLSSSRQTEESILFLDHLDHVLLSDSVRCWLQFDVIIQLGSRITSKRVSQMLQESYPCAYVFVDNHPCRHDPSHLVTHRIECSIVQFADSLMKSQFVCNGSKWHTDLRALESMVARELLFQIHSQGSTTEPYIMHVTSESLSAGSALFVGNSMVIRDADMYGHSWRILPCSTGDMVLDTELACLPLRVVGNRGASGIDGLLSTAVGFAVGCRKHVLCVVGDVSFIHDTNGLAILNQRMMRKPMTIIVINNHGGAIFSFLPIADRTDPRVLNQYFYTSHGTSIRKLCEAHGVTHLQVKTKLELRDALLAAQSEKMDFVIEVESCISFNSTFHSALRKSACKAAEKALSIVSMVSSPPFTSCSSLFKIHKMEYSLYRIELSAPPTSSSINCDPYEFHKEGYILSLFLEDGSVGYGEVALFNTKKESLLDVEEQLRYLLHVIKGTTISSFLSLLNGSFTSWMWNNLGIPESAIYPSVRCGLEMAILNAIAVREGYGFLNIFQSLPLKDESSQRSSSVKICALVDAGGTPAKVASIARSLVNEGFTAIKLKVARRADPVQDAAVVKEVRKNIGVHVELRVDANRNWAYGEAMEFSSLVKDCDLQYIEEPVHNEDDIIKFHEESGLPVALDETLDNFQEDILSMLGKYTHTGIVAVVVKPSVVGGFERAAIIGQWAQRHGKLAVISAAFESSLGLASYVLFSYYLDVQNADLCSVMNGESHKRVAHGLGTYRWLKQDVTPIALKIHHDPCIASMGASIVHASQLLQKFHINQKIIRRTFGGEPVRTYNLTVHSKDLSCSFKVCEVGEENENVVVFLHGFLGTGEEWIPIMKAVSGSARCISVDLPGHGGSKLKTHDSKEAGWEANLSMEKVADLLCRFISGRTLGKATLVGYSMGARIVLHMALRLGYKINGAVIISGSPGLKHAMVRKVRHAKDDSKAQNLVTYGLQHFIDDWYAGDLWKSLRSHPHFREVVASRTLHNDVQSLSKVLSDLSVGRQLSLWDDLKHCNLPLLFIVGEKDHKFRSIAREMWNEVSHSRKVGDNLQDGIHEIVEVPGSGHAVHVENPLLVIRALGRFLRRITSSITTADIESRSNF